MRTPHQDLTPHAVCPVQATSFCRTTRPGRMASQTKISDFGMCRIKDMEVVESLQGTYSHMAPEVIQSTESSAR